MNLPYQQWSALVAAATDGERFKNFLDPKRGVFANYEESDQFYRKVVIPLISGQVIPTVQELREFYHGSFPESAARYANSGTKLAAEVAEELLKSLKAFAPLVFPDGSGVPASLLDMGCGTGKITSALASHWNINRDKAVGLDIYRPDELPDGITFRQMSPDSLPSDIQGQGFDLITVTLVLHHAEQPEKLLRQLVEVLRPGGYLIIREHNADDPKLTPFLDFMHILYEEVFAQVPQPLPHAHNYHALSYWAGVVMDLDLAAHIAYRSYPDEAPLNTSQNGVITCRKPL